MLKKIIAFSTFLLTGIFTTAQQNVYSPYSRYAFGELNTSALTHYMGMGSASIGLADSTLLNYNNPATYCYIVRHKPIFDMAATGLRITARTTDASEQSYAGGLKNIVLGFPLTRRWGMGIGLIPFSSVGYHIRQTIDEPNIGNVEYVYYGGGGINKVFLGNGVEIIKTTRNKLSVGLNSSYVFGTISRERKAYYPSVSYLNSRIISNKVVNDFAFDAGLYYKGQINTNNWFSLGATYGFSSKINAREEFFSHTFENTGYAEYIKDTIQYVDSTKGYISLPRKIGYGIAWELRDSVDGRAYSKTIISLQYETQDWKYYTEVFGNDTVSDFLKNSSMFSLGIQFIPYISHTAGKINFWKRMNYRLGARYYTTYLSMNETQLKQYGISFGLGIPLLHSASSSMLNFSVEGGKRGTDANGLIEEKYLNFNVGISVTPHRTEGWFFKRKYD
ncbi:MAG: hypothetical protein ACOZCO_11390 [Bacteroidota bacterium]